MRGGAPSTRAHLPARSSPANPSSIPHFEPPALALEPLLTRENTRRATKKQNVATGSKCGVLGMHRHPLSPPTYGGQTEGAEAENRWLIADFILPVVHLWDYQNLKKNLHPQPPPSIIGTSDWPEFGSTPFAQSFPLPWLVELNLN